MRALKLSLTLITLTLLCIVLTALAGSQQEVKPLFERYCSVCHNGSKAPTLQAIRERILSWAQEYKTIDDAIRAEKLGESYSQLMEKMKKLAEAKTGLAMSEKDYTILYNYFKSLFEEAKKMNITPATVTITVYKTVTTTSPVYEHETVTIRLGSPAPTTTLVARASLVAAGIVGVVLIIVAAILVGRRRR